MEQTHVASIFRFSVWLTALAVAGSAFFWDLEVFLGTLFGGTLATANLYVLWRIVQAGARATTRRQGVLTALFFVKFAAMIGLVFVAVVYAPINLVAFLIGISVALVALVGVSLRAMTRANA